ncbi:MAG: transcription elongation factor GreB [Proteobacteria bacterium]|jgi:transcription elongation factor GreB|nr:transcription elongation factor GreB [Pseudomonadota bacterium]MDA1302451.1 transcription elongation factor GreB [Pseudomonadota bacterium]
MANRPFYITPDGARALRAELNHLWRTERPEITQRVADAAALGDRSENADYIYGKKRLREIDRRIRYLSKRLDNLEIVDRKPAVQDKVFFGAWLRLEDEDGHESVLRIVGADEFDLKKGWISLESPMAKGLLGKRLGDDVVVRRPAGDVEIHIVDVSYEPFEE